MVEISTSKVPGAGTDCPIGLVLIGSKGKTQTIELPDEDKSRFESGKTDRFDIEVEGDLGDPVEISLGLDVDSSKEIGVDWRIAGLELLDKGAGRRYVFPEASNAVLGRPPFQKREKSFKAQRKNQ